MKRHLSILLSFLAAIGTAVAANAATEASIKLDRRDFGVSADQDSAANEVEIVINVEADLRKPVSETR